MSQGTISALSVAHLRRMALATLARVPNAPLRRICGRVETIETRARRDVLRLLQREALAAEIETARRLHRPTSHLRREAYSITHDMLRGR